MQFAVSRTGHLIHTINEKALRLRLSVGTIVADVTQAEL